MRSMRKWHLQLLVIVALAVCNSLGARFSIDERFVREIAVPGGRIVIAQGVLSAERWMVRSLNALASDVRWDFEAGREAALAFLKRWDFPERSVGVIMDDGRLSQDGFGIRIPPLWILNLDPADRLRVYNELTNAADNNLVPMPLRHGDLTRAKELLSPSALQTLERLVMPHPEEGVFWFVPDGTFHRVTGDQNQVHLLAEVISRTPTGIPFFIGDGGAENARKAVEYFQLRQRRKEAIPMFVSFASQQLPIDLVHVLPNRLRSLAYCYPMSFPKTLEVQPDCRWTARLFNEPALPPVLEEDLADSFYDGYESVQDDLSYGDVILMATKTGRIIHSAIYIAEDLYFTKNSGHLLQPWVFMNLSEIMEIYPKIDPGEAIAMRYIGDASNKP